MKLTEKDFEDAAKKLGCEVAAIKAVAKVEGNGSGFLHNKKPKILFEGHYFWRLTNGRYGNNHYSYPKWTREYYNMDQYKRLEDAMAKDKEAAYKSASWGMFQIMGANYKKAGFKSVEAFVNAMYKSEREHLLAFVNFIIASSLDDEIRDKRWTDFAYNYNGPGFAKNRYDDKLRNAYEQFKK